MGQIFTSIVASIGNLGATESKEKLKDVFNKVFFLNFWTFAFSSICLFILLNNFILLWLGEKYLVSIDVVLLIIVNFFITGMRKAVLNFRDALGIFWYDRYKPILEVAINLVVSIVLAQKIGLAGVFIGTIVSSLMTSFWIEPYVLYKYGLKVKVREYFKQYIKYTIITILVGILTLFTVNILFTSVSIISFIGKTILCISIPNLCFILIFRKTEEFKYYEKLIMLLIYKIRSAKTENLKI